MTTATPCEHCEHCGKSRLPGSKGRFCSKTCSNSARKKPSVDLTCLSCGITFTVSYQLRDRKTCSRTCAATYGMSQVDKTAFGQAISVARREGIDSGRIVPQGHRHSEETRRHLSEISSGGKRSGSNNGMFGRQHTDESRAAMSETRTRKIVAGEYDKSKWAKKGEVISVKAGRTISYRSSWELRAIEILEEDSDVVSFQFEPFRIPYYYGLRQDNSPQRRHYIPDFLVTYADGHRTLVEIKPNCYVHAAVNVAKASAAKEYCEEIGVTFEFWTQDRLYIKETS